MKGNHLHDLWAGTLPGGPPCPHMDPDAIVRRVDAALDAVPSERRRYMRQKLRFAAVLTAILVALGGTALGVAARWDVLSAYFSGDTSPAQDLVDREVRTVSDKDYTITVESSVSDSASALLLIRVDAHTEEARTFMASDNFNGIDTWNIHPLAPEVGEDGEIKLEYHGGSVSYSEVKDLRTESSTTWRFNVDLIGTDYTHLHVRMGYMEKGLYLEFPLTPADAVTVEIGAAGEGLAWYDARSAGHVTLDSVTISPLTFQMNVSWTDGSHVYQGALPPVLFRMADGSLRTMAQTLHQINTYSNLDDPNGSGTPPYHGCWPIRFNSVQDLSQLAGIVVWGREYPLDGGPSKAVEVDEGLLPFHSPAGPLPGVGGVGYTVPVRALCEGLGASCEWDAGTGTVTMTYRGVTVALTWGSDTALVDGQPVALYAPAFLVDGEGEVWLTPEAPGAEGVRQGVLCVEVSPLEDAWGLWLSLPCDDESLSNTDWDVYP